MRLLVDTSKNRARAGALWALLILLAGSVAAGCGGSGGTSENTIAVVGYSLPGPIYEKVLEPAFQKTPQGKGVIFTNSFGTSSDQSRAVAAGRPASVVHFSQAGDVERLVKAGDVTPRWAENFASGMGHNSTVALIVRNGNPKHLKSLDDLLTKNVKIVIPNPISSSAARWDIMAIYGAQVHEGKSPQEVLEAIKAILEKAVVQPPNARNALDAFRQGTGDVLLGFESEGIDLKREGAADYVVPPRTILVETPIAVTKDASPAAKAFVEFIWSDQGQELWAAHGYRPVYTRLIGSKFPTPPDLFAIIEFGDWKKLNKELFDAKTGSIARIEKELGVPANG